MVLFDIENIETEIHKKLTLQDYNGMSDLSKMVGISDLQTKLLNQMQLFAVIVNTYNLKFNPILVSARKTFVDCVEIHILGIFLHKMSASRDSFEAVLNLYNDWKNLIDRKSPNDRIDEFRKKMFIEGEAS